MSPRREHEATRQNRHATFHIAGCYCQNDLLLFVYGSIDLKSVQDQKSFHCRMTDTFVAVNERMILNQGKA